MNNNMCNIMDSVRYPAHFLMFNSNVILLFWFTVKHPSTAYMAMTYVM